MTFIRLPAKFKPTLFAACALPVILASSIESRAQQLEEIVVTAQKREQSAQDVPISITAVSGQQLRLSGAGNLEGLSDSLPNVDIADSPGVTRVVIRGLGSGTGNAAFEQSVGMFVDGIYASRAALFQAPFLDVQRIEVLKGPQGVLFGKNSIAGALSLVSNRPTENFEAEINASYDVEYGSREISGFISGPLTDDVYGRLSARVSADESYMSNGLLGGEMPTTDTAVVRAMMIWDASDDTEVLLKVETSKLDENGSDWQVFADYSPGSLPYLLENSPASVPAAAALPAAIYGLGRAAGEDYVYDGVATPNYSGYLDQEADNITLQVTHTLGDHELVYLLGYGQYRREQFSDQDFMAPSVTRTTKTETFEQVSHELRIASAAGETFEYIAGLYYLDRDFDLDTDQHGFGFHPMLAFSANGEYREQGTSYSVFAQLSWNISDDWRASMGLRYSQEEKDASNYKLNRVYQSETSLQIADPARYARVGAVINYRDFSYADSRDESNLDPAFNVQWDFSDDGMAYVSLVAANKAGGFNTSESAGDMTNFGFEPESASSLEVGIKTELLDGRARLNASLFRTEFEDLQVGAFDPSVNGFVVRNAAKAISQGLEVDGMYAFSESLTLGGSVAYLRAEYKDFTAGCPNNAVQAAKLDCYQNPNGSGQLIQDLDGVQLENAPKLTASLFAEYSVPLTDDLLFGSRFDASYKDEASLDFSQDENLFADDYWRMNLRLSLSSMADSWTVAVTVFNLSDEQTATFGGQEFLLPGVYWSNRGRGREVELSATYRFSN